MCRLKKEGMQYYAFLFIEKNKTVLARLSAIFASSLSFFFHRIVVVVFNYFVLCYTMRTIAITIFCTSSHVTEAKVTIGNEGG